MGRSSQPVTTGEIPELTTTPDKLLAYAKRGDTSDANRANLQEALMVLRFQLLVQQKRTAKAQFWATIGTFLLFAATICLVIATA